MQKAPQLIILKIKTFSKYCNKSICSNCFTQFNNVNMRIILVPVQRYGPLCPFNVIEWVKLSLGSMISKVNDLKENIIIQQLGNLK